MKQWIGAVALAVLMVGCTANKKDMTASSDSVMDVAPPPAPMVAQTPVVNPAPAPAVEPIVTQTPPPVAAGNTYTVKKGDTLYSIARTHYGNGKQYTRIVEANPGVSARALRVGQTLIIP